MRKFIIAFIAAFAFIAIGLVVVMVCAINGNFHVASFKSSEAKLVNTQNISLENIDSINIKYYSDDIKFYTSDTDELILKEYRVDNDEDRLATIETNGNELSIVGAKFNMHFIVFGFNNSYNRVEVYLPSGYTGSLSASSTSGEINSDLALKLKQCNLSCSSGDIDMNEIYAEDINVSTSSGEIIIQRAEGKRSISSTSGDIRVKGGSGDSTFSSSSGEIIVEKSQGLLNVDTTSGDIKITDSKGEKTIETSSGEVIVEKSSGIINASTASGDVRINALDGGGNISTTSGEVKFELSELSDDINVNTSSGDVTLNLPETVSCDFSADTTSGDIKTFFDDKLSFNKDGDNAKGTVGDNPDKVIKIDTTSGEIYVKEK